MSQLVTFAACGILLSIASITTEHSSVFAQQKIKPTTTPLLISQTRQLRAESGPDDKGRWRFYKPNDVSDDAMQAQGCTNVGVGGSSGANWRCPRERIRVEADGDSRSRDSRYDDDDSRNRDYRYGASTRQLRAESGPDDKGRWRFYKPNDVSDDAMQAQGCTNVGVGGSSGANWRCPRERIRVEADGDSRSRDSRYDDDDSRNRDYRYGASTRQLRAESGPDDKGRWRFYKPENVSDDAMEAQGCTNVGLGGASGANWRCPRERIRVEADNRR
ncbi:MAG: hypothetical protein RMX69_05730 [Nostoc sp. EspVER01]|uniref:hypothetical protein n=1 Tax=Nostoc sp. EspVER01 TaxID=3075408 RepID=UPI002AD2E0D3|nr:hypothetical protein [Nostoc sp. EspVER01]MDZ7991712.1 hypothetical protein [Nostoc sp. EspVER01]